MESETDAQPVAPRLVVAPLVGEEVAAFSVDELTYNETLGDWRTHDGIDIAADTGTAIGCFADGTVGTVGESNILGNYVTVNHEGGFSTLYAHCSAITASAGQSVKKGDAIAKVGSTGNATGSHLHFEVHDGEEYLNPVYYAVP